MNGNEREAEAAFVRRLAILIPWIEPLLATHVAERSGDMYPYLLVHEVTIEAAKRLESQKDVTGFLDEMEAAFGVDPAVDELIHDSFLYRLGTRENRGPGLVPLLGQKLSAEMPYYQAPADVDATFLRRLVGANPWLEPLLEEHLTYHEEMLSHFLISAIRRALTRGEATPEQVRGVLDRLEAEFGLLQEVDELIAASFVEMLPYPDEPGAAIVAELGPKLTAELRFQRPLSFYAQEGVAPNLDPGLPRALLAAENVELTVSVAHRELSLVLSRLWKVLYGVEDPGVREAYADLFRAGTLLVETGAALNASAGSLRAEAVASGAEVEPSRPVVTDPVLAPAVTALIRRPSADWTDDLSVADLVHHRRTDLRGAPVRNWKRAEAFLRRLAESNWWLAEKIEGHVQESEGQLIPHVLMDLVTFAAVAESARPQVRALVDALENVWGTDDELDDFIAASFLPLLPHRQHGGIMSLLGPKLRSELETQRRGVHRVDGL